ncbi:MAG: FtsW/RodA/SpoVE family cell cycle protein [Leptospiraceae bacterium]|nr:FtsW/RodA/SpoVE family cell cycle protein [Leptospiraceae bacterium]MDW8306810.1 FtsW/RodA/SpoVE family cell cycle protein [Leptospiraceae bacterium]
MRGKIDYLLITFAVGSSLIGILTLLGGGGIGEELAFKKTLWLIIGVALMLVFAFTNYQKLGVYAPLLYGLGILLLVLTLLPFVGTKIKGARAWLRLYGMGFQPSEFMKLFLVIALSRYLVLRETEIDKPRELIIPALMALVPAVLIALQPDLGYAMMYLVLLFALLYIGGANTSVIFGFAIVGFSTLVIPLYLEYEKYILVDDLYARLKEINFRLADAVRVLSFEIWEYIERPELSGLISEKDSLKRWAAMELVKSDNLALLKTIVQDLEKENPSLLRDFFRSNLAMILSIVVLALIYFIFWVLYYAIRRAWYRRITTMALIGALSLAGAFVFRKLVNFKPHQVVRIISFANPEKFPKGAGYQLRHSLITLGSGKILGKGIFKGDMTRGETPYLPEWYNDFIFSVIGEQFGLWGTTLTLFFLFGLVFRGVQIALQSKDDFGALLAAGITVIFFSHIVINIGIALGLLPVTGIPLVFVSYGGSNMIVSFIAVGILLNIYMRRFINA